MRLFIASLLCVMVTSLCGAEAFRIRSVTEKTVNGSWSSNVQHGTAFICDWKIVTAAHVVGEVIGGKFVVYDTIYVEQYCGWVRLKLVKVDTDWDVAVLTPVSVMITPEDTKATDTGCYASVKAAAVTKLKASNIGSKSATVPGYDHGGSGAPIYKDGRFAGMARAFQDEGNKDKVDMVPSVIIDSILAGCK